MEQLLMRNMQLETELQLTKIRAVQAETTLLHLAGRNSDFAGRSTTDHTVARLTADVQALRDEVFHINRKLLRQHEQCENADPSSDVSTEPTETINRRAAGDEGKQSTKINGACQTSILHGRSAHDTCLQSGANTESIKVDVHAAGSKHGVAQGPASPYPHHHSSNRVSVRNNVDVAPLSNAYESPMVKPDTGVRLSAQRHNNLSGAATYIEDMSDVEKEIFWQEQARRYDSTISAERLRDYYETEIRPRFVARTEGKREETRQWATPEFKASSNPARDSIAKPQEAGISLATTATEKLPSLHEEGNHGSTGLLASRWAGPALGHSSAKIATPRQVGDAEVGDAKTHSCSPTSLVEEEYQEVASASGKRSSSHNLRQAKELMFEANTTTPESSMIAEPYDLAGEESSFEAKMVESLVPSMMSIPHQSLLELDAKASPETGRDVDSADVKKTPHATSTGGLVGHLSGRAPPGCSILISNVPTPVKLAEVLDKVCGGRLRSATMLRTAGMRTRPCIDTNTVWLTFLELEGALRFAHCCENSKLVFMDGGNRLVTAEVTRLHTNAHAPEADIRHQVEGRTRSTRILYLHDTNNQWTPEKVVEELTQFQNRGRHGFAASLDRDGLNSLMAKPLRKGRTPAGLIYLEYAGLSGAKWTFDLIASTMKNIFHGVDCGFLSDPCERTCDIRRATPPANESPLIQFAPSEQDSEECGNMLDFSLSGQSGSQVEESAMDRARGQAATGAEPGRRSEDSAEDISSLR